MTRPTGVVLAAVIALAGCGGGSNIGYVWVDSVNANRNDAPAIGASAVAQFVRNRNRTASPTDATSACSSIVRAGSCAVYSGCTSPMTSASANPVSAGVITVIGGLVPLVLTPSLYSSGELGQPAWQGGETITFSGSGGSIPAFEGRTTAPVTATISAPAPTQMADGSLSLTVDPTHDLAFTWTPTAPATLEVVFVNNDTTLFCELDATTGQGVITTQLLQLFPAGQGSMGVGSINDDIVTAGDWSIILETQSGSVTPSAVEFEGAVVLL